MVAVNKTKCATRSRHNKWYYPWRFPSIQKGKIEEDVVITMLAEISYRSARTYSGFEVKTQPLLSDSDGPIMLSGDDSADERADALQILARDAKLYGIEGGSFGRRS